jgi:hypothetical protein
MRITGKLLKPFNFSVNEKKQNDDNTRPWKNTRASNPRR